MRFSRIVSLAILLALIVTIPLASAQAPAEVTSPTSQTLNAIIPASTTQAWAVGNNGAIIRWDGTNWNLESSSTTANLNSISMANSTSIWAVGSINGDGAIVYWNGETWANFEDEDLTGVPLFGVSMLDGSFGWAVGESGTALVWDGSDWAGITDLTTSTLRSVATVSVTDAWAVGDDGVILRWTGTEWTDFDSPTNSDLKSVFMFNANDGWIVGGEQDTGIILRWDGTDWTQFNQIVTYHPEGDGDNQPSDVMDNVNATLYSVFVCDQGEGWASGAEGMVVYWNGTMWNAIGSGATETLRGIAVVNPATDTTESKGYTVGDGGIILGWEGHQWIPEISVLILAPILLTFAGLLLLLRRTAKKPNLFFFRK